jgi:pimeloyl-ACP methyl ester carboxylesterase
MVFSVLKISALAYLGFGLFLYFAQRSFLYFPTAERDASDVTTEYLKSDGETIELWVLTPGADKAVVYFGGNAEDVYFNADDFRRTLPNHSVYLVNYRGYGGSSGSPTEANLFADALHIFDELRDRHDEIAVIGRSLGSGVATYLASERDVDRLVLATPLDSALALAKSMYPVYPVSLLLKDRYESIRYAPRINAPTLIVVAEHDRVIPRKHSDRLVEAFAAGVAEVVVIANAGHNGLSGHRDYWDAFDRFLNP